MNDRFFKQTVTLFLFNKESQEFDRIVIDNVYFRYFEKTRMTDNGLIRTSGGSVTIPLEYAKIEDTKALYSYKSNNNILEFVLNGILTSKTWSLDSKSFVIEGNVPDMTYSELIKQYHIYRVTSVQDNRKGNLQHIKIEVND
jgi:hypothetical protein